MIVADTCKSSLLSRTAITAIVMRVAFMSRSGIRVPHLPLLCRLAADASQTSAVAETVPGLDVQFLDNRIGPSAYLNEDTPEILPHYAQHEKDTASEKRNEDGESRKARNRNVA